MGTYAEMEEQVVVSVGETKGTQHTENRRLRELNRKLVKENRKLQRALALRTPCWEKGVLDE
jgi:hypothetical protein